MSYYALVETNKLHLEGIYNNFDIHYYSVDSSLSVICFTENEPPFTIRILTQEEFNALKQTPEWNHDLIQDES